MQKSWGLIGPGGNSVPVVMKIHNKSTFTSSSVETTPKLLQRMGFSDRKKNAALPASSVKRACLNLMYYAIRLEMLHTVLFIFHVLNVFTLSANIR